MTVRLRLSISIALGTVQSALPDKVVAEFIALFAPRDVSDPSDLWLCEHQRQHCGLIRSIDGRISGVDSLCATSSVQFIGVVLLGQDHADE